MIVFPWQTRRSFTWLYSRERPVEEAWSRLWCHLQRRGAVRSRCVWLWRGEKVKCRRREIRPPPAARSSLASAELHLQNRRSQQSLCQTADTRSLSASDDLLLQPWRHVKPLHFCVSLTGDQRDVKAHVAARHDSASPGFQQHSADDKLLLLFSDCRQKLETLSTHDICSNLPLHTQTLWRKTIAVCHATAPPWGQMTFVSFGWSLALGSTVCGHKSYIKQCIIQKHCWIILDDLHHCSIFAGTSEFLVSPQQDMRSWGTRSVPILMLLHGGLIHQFTFRVNDDSTFVIFCRW